MSAIWEAYTAELWVQWSLNRDQSQLSISGIQHQMHPRPGEAHEEAGCGHSHLHPNPIWCVPSVAQNFYVTWRQWLTVQPWAVCRLSVKTLTSITAKQVPQPPGSRALFVSVLKAINQSEFLYLSRRCCLDFTLSRRLHIQSCGPLRPPLFTMPDHRVFRLAFSCLAAEKELASQAWAAKHD